MLEAERGQAWRDRLDRHGRPWVRTPPRYERRWHLPDAPAKRDRWWRRDATLAAGEAVAAGEMTRLAFDVYVAVLAFSNDTGDPCWPSQQSIAERAGLSSDRTVRTAMAELRAGGWIVDCHRIRRDQQTGELRQVSNLIRPTLPAAVECRRAVRKAQAKRTAAERRQPRPKPPLPGDDQRPTPPLYVSASAPKPPSRPEPGATGRAMADRAARMAQRARGGSSPP